MLTYSSSSIRARPHSLRPCANHLISAVENQGGSGRACRTAGVRLAPAYLDRIGTEAIFNTLGGGPARRYDEVAAIEFMTDSTVLLLEPVDQDRSGH